MTFHAACYDSKLGYVAEDDRQLLGSLVNIVMGASSTGNNFGGVLGPYDLLASAGSGMNSQIAAGRGAVLNTYAGQTSGNPFFWAGGAWLVRNDGTVQTPAHAANSSGSPRIDAVGVQVYDSDTGGSSSDVTNPIVVTGTPNGSATLANLDSAPGQSGGPSLPPNFVILAYVLVPNGAGSSASFTYRDNRTIIVPAGQMPYLSQPTGGTLVAGCANFLTHGQTYAMPQYAGYGTLIQLETDSSTTSAAPVTVDFTSGTVYGPNLSLNSPFAWIVANSTVTLMSDGVGGWRLVSGALVPTGLEVVSVTGAASLSVGEMALCTGMPYTVTFPSAPANGEEVGIMVGGSGGTTLTVAGAAGQTIFGMGLASVSSFTFSVPGSYAVFQWVAAASSWVIVAGGQDTSQQPIVIVTATGANSVPIPAGYQYMSVELVGGGGGGAGSSHSSSPTVGGAGGGGGEIITGTYSLSGVTSPLTVTIGTSGNGGGAQVNGSAGVASTIAATGLTTITAEPGYGGNTDTSGIQTTGGNSGAYSSSTIASTGVSPTVPGCGGWGALGTQAGYPGGNSAGTAPGGGGGGVTGGAGGVGGNGPYGNGGNGGSGTGPTAGSAGVPNSGAGGGGGGGTTSTNTAGGNGGSGYAVIRFLP